MTLSRRQLLTGGAAALGGAALLTRGASAQAKAAGKNLIVVLVYGGWDVTYALDPKPGLATIDVPEGEVEVIGGIPIFADPSRPNVTSFFERHAGITTVVNGLQVQSINHPDCTKRVLTGTASDTSPDVGAIASFELGRDLPAPYLVLGPIAYTGPFASVTARTGTVNQIRGLLDPTLAFPPASGTVRFLPDDVESGLIRSYVEARAAREQAIRGQHGYNQKRFEDFKRSLERGDLLKGFTQGFGDDFEFTLDLRVQIDLGLRALEQGLAHSLHLEQAFASWDTHAENSFQAILYEDLFDALGTLADELTTRPGKASGSKMIDETVVLVVSEMSRTPKLNDAAGKDHWPVTSALVFGGGVTGGRALGASGDELESLPIDLGTGSPDPGGQVLSYGSFAAGVLDLIGVDSETYLPNVDPFSGFIA